jgi:hypothetical protein
MWAEKTVATHPTITKTDCRSETVRQKKTPIIRRFPDWFPHTAFPATVLGCRKGREEVMVGYLATPNTVSNTTTIHLLR